MRDLADVPCPPNLFEDRSWLFLSGECPNPVSVCAGVIIARRARGPRRARDVALRSSPIGYAIPAAITGVRSRSRLRTPERDPRRGRRDGGRHRPTGGDRGGAPG